MCGAVLACLCRVFRAPPGSGRGVALGGCPLAACAWCCAGSDFPVVARCAAGCCAQAVLGLGIRGCMAARLGACSGDSFFIFIFILNYLNTRSLQQFQNKTKRKKRT